MVNNDLVKIIGSMLKGGIHKGDRGLIMSVRNRFIIAMFASVLLGVFGVKTVDYFTKHRKRDVDEKKAVRQAALNKLTALTSGIKAVDMPRESFMQEIAPKYVRRIMKDTPQLAKAGFDDRMILTLMQPMLNMVFDKFVK